MTTVDHWTGREAKLLRQALRLSVRDFAARLGVGVRTVNKWEARQADITPLPHMQEVLDTALARASDEGRARFAAARADVPDQETAQSPELPPRGGMLPVVVNGRLVFVPFDADTLAASDLGAVFGEWQYAAIALADARRSVGGSTVDDELTGPVLWDDIVPTVGRLSLQKFPGIDDMDRREVLRLISVVGALLVTPCGDDHLDWERLDSFSQRTSRIGAATINEHARLNAYLWRVFVAAKSKRAVLPFVRNRLEVLTDTLRRPHEADAHKRLCALAGDLFQLAGEIFFDGNRYAEAAHCYTLAATASKEANDFDLWACAITRRAFIDVYERQFDKAVQILELAAGVAGRGDSALSTRQWVHAVRAQSFAGLGELDACRRALDAAAQVNQLTGQVHTGGWLRFDGSRLAEEQGTCYVELRRPDLAEVALTNALNLDLSTRRRGSVLTDFAMIGVQRRDPENLVMYAGAALDAARQSGSGVIGRKLLGLQAQLGPFLSDSHVRHLDAQITALVRASVN